MIGIAVISGGYKSPAARVRLTENLTNYRGRSAGLGLKSTLGIVWACLCSRNVTHDSSRLTHAQRPPKYRQNGPSSREMLPLLQEQGMNNSAYRRRPPMNTRIHQERKRWRKWGERRGKDEAREHTTDCHGR